MANALQYCTNVLEFVQLYICKWTCPDICIDIDWSVAERQSHLRRIRYNQIKLVFFRYVSIVRTLSEILELHVLADFMYFSVLLYAGLGRILRGIGAYYFDVTSILNCASVFMRLLDRIEWEGFEESDRSTRSCFGQSRRGWVSCTDRTIFPTRLGKEIRDVERIIKAFLSSECEPRVDS